MSAIPDQLKESLFLVSGETHPGLAADIAHDMGMALGGVALHAHPNTEPYVRYTDSVRGKHVMVMQPHAPAHGRSVSDSLHQQLEMIYAARLASADTITAVSTNLAGARQDRKARGRESVSIALNLRMMQVAGASRIVTVDLHSPQTQAIFDGPFDHLTAQPMLRDALATRITGSPEDYVVVSPDIGHAKMSAEHADRLGIDVVHMGKKRDPRDSAKVIRQDSVHGVEGRTCFILDDMIDTAGTIQTAAEVLRDSGAKAVHVAATHGWFSPPAAERLTDASIDEVVITDTLPLDPETRAMLESKLTVVSVAGMVSSALAEIVTQGSVSRLFDDQNYR